MSSEPAPDFFLKQKMIADQQATIADLGDAVLQLQQQLAVHKDNRCLIDSNRVLTALEQINRIIRRSDDLDSMLQELLNACLSIFECDRSWLAYPCDPETITWQMRHECCHPEIPETQDCAVDIPLLPEMADLFRSALINDSALRFDAKSGREPPAEMTKNFAVRSQIVIAIKPRTGKPWLLGLHQCSFPRIWQREEVRLFQTIANHLGDAISSLLSLQELDKSENQLRSLLSSTINAMPSALISIDPQRQITQWNLEAEKLLGIQAELALHQPLETTCPALKPFRNLIDRALQTSAVESQQRVSFDSKAKQTQVDITIFPLGSRQLTGAVIRIDDISERVRLEEVIIQNEKMMSVGNLAAGIAHELNNPLAGIMQSLQLMRTRFSDRLQKNVQVANACGTDIVAIQRYLQKRGISPLIDSAIDSGQRAADIVLNMLSFSRKNERDDQHNDLREILDKAVELAASNYNLKLQYDFRKILLVREFDDDLPTIACNRGQIQQVFLNLLNNGAQAMTERLRLWEQQLGELPPEMEKACFTLRLNKDEDMLRCEIVDNGCGMDKKTRMQIFEPFFTTKQSGTGLGLAICYFIVTENHLGRMSVDSAPGIGSRFSVELPLQQTHDNLDVASWNM